MNIGIYVYDLAEVLDFSGPFEVFTTASRICRGAEPFRVFLIGERSGVIHARGGYRVMSDFSISDHPPIDVLIVAGGVHQEEMQKPDVIRWMRSVAN